MRACLFISLVTLCPSLILAQSNEPTFKFSHTGSFVVSVDDDGVLNFPRGLVSFNAIAADRVQTVLTFDFRPIIARKRIEKRLRTSPELIGAITHAIKVQIAAARGIKDLTLITVPPALVDEQVAAYIDDHITDEAVTETTIREAYIRAALNTRLSEIGRNATVAILEVGKLEPVHQTESDFANNPAQGLYYFAVSQPAIRLKGQINDKTTLYAQVSNDRHGAVEDASGSDAIGFTKDMLSRSSGEVLEYSINSREAGIVQATPGGVVVAAVGRRPQRDLLTRGELRDNNYVVARFRTDLDALTLQVQGTVEGASGAESVKRANFIVSRALMRERVAVGTQLFLREGGDQQRITSWLAGANVKLIKRENFEFGGGAKYSLFNLGNVSGSRGEVGIGFGWSVR